MADASCVLAPMVRLGTLPLRLLSLERGAALVYSEEIVDGKLAKSKRTADTRLGTTDWRVGSGIILRTCKEEHGKLVVQLGTADVATALGAIKALEFDPTDPRRDGIIGIDINMGCPKRSAAAGGSGGALFADSERAEAIVRAIRNVVPAQIRLSCKVRLHHTGPEETTRRCLRLVDAGATAIAVHARYATERSCDLARWQELGVVAAALRQRGVDVLLNGDVLDSIAASALRLAAPGCTIMIGRGALHAVNGAFAPQASDGLAAEGGSSMAMHTDEEDGLDEATLQLCVRYAKLAIRLENPPLNTAFVLQWMLHARIRERRPPITLQPERSAVPETPELPAVIAVRKVVEVAEVGEVVPTTSSTGSFTTVDSVAVALRGASSMLAIASALGLTSFLNETTRGMPAAPTHRYTPSYFQELDGMSDWARAPSRAVLREAHAAATAPLVTNGDFSRLVQSRAALTPKGGSSSSGGGGSAAGAVTASAVTAGTVTIPAASSAAPSVEKAAEDEPHSRLLLAVGPNVQVKYYVLEETAPGAKALGYFAAAWRCRAVVGGRPFDGALRRSRYRAEQHAAEVAIVGLAACPLDPAKAKRRAKRDEKKRKRP